MDLRLARLLVALTAIALVLGGCSGSTHGKGTKAVSPLVGAYHLVGDVNGTKIRTDATITLTLKADGTLTVHAVEPGETLDDTGTWTTAGTSMTITFTDEKIKGSGAYSLSGATLTLPVQVLDDGTGSSTWTRVGSAAPTTGSTSTSTTPALQSTNEWSLWDLTDDAAAAGTKAYTDAVTGGASASDALQTALTAVKALSDVKDAQVSPNGINIDITYTDGTVDYVDEEKLQPSDATGHLVDLGGRLSTRAAASGCQTLPGQSADPTEPGREGINPGGGYGVARYIAGVQPKPITSADSPATSMRRALLLAPQWDVPYMEPGGTFTSIHQISNSDNVGCVTASLQKAGYTVDPIVGSVVNGQPVHTGDAAAREIITDLTTKTYGVVYFIGHGFSADTSFGGMEVGPVDLSQPTIKAIINGKPITHEMGGKIVEQEAKNLGVSFDAANPSLFLAKGSNGLPDLVLRPPFFSEMVSRGADFTHSFVFINGCSSGKDNILAKAIKAKAYLGWKNEMAGQFVSDAGEAIMDTLTDKVRTVRMASETWQLHQIWVDGGRTAAQAQDPNLNPFNLVALGTNFQAYPYMDESAFVLIYALRNRPESGTANIKLQGQFIDNCYSVVWKFHLGALKSPQCHPLATPTDPSEADVIDAEFEVGLLGSTKEPTGRFTLTD